MTSPFALPGQEAPANVRQFKRADRFINRSIPRNDGTACKFDSIKLYKDNPDHAELIKGLDSGEITIEDVVASMTHEYRSAEKNASGLNLKKADAPVQGS